MEFTFQCVCLFSSISLCPTFSIHLGLFPTFSRLERKLPAPPPHLLLLLHPPPGAHASFLLFCKVFLLMSIFFSLLLSFPFFFLLSIPSHAHTRTPNPGLSASAGTRARNPLSKIVKISAGRLSLALRNSATMAVAHTRVDTPRQWRRRVHHLLLPSPPPAPPSYHLDRGVTFGERSVKNNFIHLFPPRREELPPCLPAPSPAL